MFYSANFETAPVGTTPDGAGRWGHQDLAGNLAEWSFDCFEEGFYDCDPALSDTDGDGISDYDELMVGWRVRDLDYEVYPDPTTADADLDGLSDEREVSLGTDPALPDSDGDGFSDFDEVEAGSDPLSADDQPTATGLNLILIKSALDARR